MKYSKEEIDFLKNNIDKCCNCAELTEWFNANFPNHPVTHDALRKHLQLCKIYKPNWKMRKDRVWSRNPLETVIGGKGHGQRVKTENGYVSANRYFKEKYYGKNAKGFLVHLNGDKTDFSSENVMLVSKSIYSSLCWRGWFFTDPELMKAAILTVELLSFFPELIHNENQYFKMARS